MHFQIMYVIVVNVKAYEMGIGKHAEHLAKIMEELSEEYDVRMIIAVQSCDIFRLANCTNVDVFSQHIDPINYGNYTGWVSPYAIKAAGAKGSIINHSEHRTKIEDISQTVMITKKINLEVIACASSVPVARAIACLSPDYIAIEPPELIGGDISVTTAKPDIVKDAVNAVCEINKYVDVLCGAGIKNGTDAKIAVELGASGILVASGVVKKEDKKKILAEMAEAMVK